MLVIPWWAPISVQTICNKLHGPTHQCADLDIDTGEEENKWGGGNIYLDTAIISEGEVSGGQAAECGVWGREGQAFTRAYR